MSTEAVSQILDQGKTSDPQLTSSGGAGEGMDAAPASAPKGDEKLSSRIEMLIKREQQAQARERYATQKEQELEARLKRIEEFESAKANPKKALELLGLDYDELTKTMLNDGNVPPEVEIKKLRKEWEEERHKQALKEQEAVEAQRKSAQANEERAIAGFKEQINQYLSDNKDRYELISFEEQQDLVFAVIDEHFNRTIDPQTGTGKVMSISEAADKVEKFLEEKYHKSRDLNKVKALWGNLPKSVQREVEKREQAPTKPQTLSNQLSAQPSKPRKTPLTDEERVAKAIAYARGLRT